MISEFFILYFSRYLEAYEDSLLFRLSVLVSVLQCHVSLLSGYERVGVPNIFSYFVVGRTMDKSWPARGSYIGMILIP